MDESLDTVPGLEKRGFEGFCSIKDLRNAWSMHHPPPHKGVYLVIWDRKDRPEFIDPGTGGYFQDKEPNVSIDKLENHWVEDALIIYVGANKEGKKGNLKDRIELLLLFGDGENVGHYGGRLMWQIKDAEELKICWKDVADDKQEEEGKQMLAEFKQAHGKLPFASRPNARRPNRKN